MTLPELFLSPEGMGDTFIAGLERQLAEPGLGTHILVLANASFDPSIWPRLAQGLHRRFNDLRAHVRQGLRTGQKLAYPDDDLMVFLKLMAMGFDAVRPTLTRNVGPWEIQFNLLRALRPARASGQKVDGVTPPAFNPAGFHFNKPFLAKEILWQGSLLKRDCRLLYNKFPFAPFHGLLVPEPERALPQLLTQELHLYAWHLTENLGTSLPGWGLSYNSYGAYASVNHLHFQTFLRPTPMPIQDAAWSHNGGEEEYPAQCHVFDTALDTWFFLEHLHKHETPYNLIYTPGRLYCLPRSPQGSHEQAPWNPGFAWHEMAGGILAFSQEHYANLAEAEISEELRRTRPSV